MWRELIQELEGWQRAGVTRISPLDLSVFAVPPVSAVTSPPVQPPTSSRAVTTVASSPQKPLTEVPETPMPKKAPNPVLVEMAARCQTFQPLDLSPDQRREHLAVLQATVSQCTRCDELARTRTQTVFGVGNPEARIVFVGEAPGADEDKQGEPFVGRAGQLLNDIIKACRLRREDIYICNVLRCRPPGNRLPSPEEAVNCREYLDGQIAIVNPEYIVCWGACAAKNLLGSEEAITKMRGKFYKYGRAKVLCTYHPSYLLRNPPAKKEVWEDMKFLFRDMGIDLSAK